MKIFEISTEDVQPTQTVQEHELVFYGTIDSLEQLKQAFKAERHAQYEKKLDNGRIRVRSIEDNSGKRFELTLKRKDPTKDGVLESTTEIDERFFNEFRLCCEEGMIKDRFLFKTETEGIFWEVDVFKDPEGNYYRWCKIDLELDGQQIDVKAFPISLSNVIVQHKATDEEKKAISVLYEKYFLSKVNS